jgi:hypothetical protein
MPVAKGEMSLPPASDVAHAVFEDYLPLEGRAGDEDEDDDDECDDDEPPDPPPPEDGCEGGGGVCAGAW